MLLKCAYTGISLNIGMFNGYTGISVHPFIQLPIQKLSALASKENLEPQESKILFIAYLAAMPTVHFTCPVSMPKISDVLIEHSFSQVVALANWLHSVDKVKGLPEYRITPETCNLGGFREYLGALQSYKTYGGYTTDDSYSSRILTPEELEEKKAALKAEWIRKASHKENFKSTVLWAIMHLRRSCPNFGEVAEREAKSVFAGQYALMQNIKNLRCQCLDFLPENTSDDHIRKFEILAKLETFITEKIQLSQILGLDISASSQDLEDIESTYTIHTKQGSHLNSAAMPARNLAKIHAQSAGGMDYAPVEVVATPKQAPKREDYASAAHFLVAQTKWRRENK